MVIPDGSCRNKLHTTIIKQACIATCTSTYDEGIGITHRGTINFTSWEIYSLNVHFRESLTDIRNFIVYYNFHAIQVYFQGPY